MGDKRVRKVWGVMWSEWDGRLAGGQVRWSAMGQQPRYSRRFLWVWFCRGFLLKAMVFGALLALVLGIVWMFLLVEHFPQLVEVELLEVRGL